MASIGRKLEAKGVIAMTLLTLVLIGMACEDKIGNPEVNPSDGKQVEVSLNIGFADEEDGISLSNNSRSNNTAAGENTTSQKQAFDAQLVSEVETRAGEVKPNQLYNLEIQQYNQSGSRIGGTASAIAQQGIGSALSLSLIEDPNCQLVIVAWGTSITERLGTGTFSAACDVLIDQSAIQDLDPANANDMNKMPYYIYLPSVKVSSNTITNPNGTDVRLLLKRLATRVTLNWTYSLNDYNLKEVRLEGVPTNYRAIPFINTVDNTYPSLLDQYTTIIVPANKISDEGSYSCWIPASLRGTSNKATSAYYRNKENAPTGSVYATFIAQNNSSEKKKLNYRLYLGGNTSDNFDLNPNTNYNYQVNFKNIFPTNDRRVSIIDPIPASTNNDMPSPTANCFMVAPGGAFCFNPYKYYVNGIQGENSTLQGWCSTNKIKSVKVLWQTKENGDLGDPTLGVVISDDDHTNIVELKNGDSFTDARIYCRVAPNTTGGSGVIAACDINGNILWSWHVWVTDYSPSATANETILTPENKRILKLERNGVSYNPMMDRCLGAYEGYVSVPEKIVDMSRANGFHYQKGRKDPFPGSYPSADLPTQYHFEINGKQPPRHCLNRYKPDGITWIMPSSLEMNTLQYAYQHPESLAIGYNHEWARFKPIPTWSNDKTIHDPCPAGWRVPSETELQILVDYNRPNQSSILVNYKADGGALFQYDGTSNRTYMRFSGYPVSVSHIANIGYAVYLQTNRTSRIFYAQGVGGAESTNGIIFVNKDNYDANNVRCIQDR